MEEKIPRCAYCGEDVPSLLQDNHTTMPPGPDESQSMTTITRKAGEAHAVRASAPRTGQGKGWTIQRLSVEIGVNPPPSGDGRPGAIGSPRPCPGSCATCSG